MMIKNPKEESLEFYRNLSIHPVGTPKDKIPLKAEIEMTDAELVAFYSERYLNVDVAEFLLNDRKERLFGLCNMVREGEFYLDVCCANGGHMEVLYLRGINGVGLDLSIPNILRGREKYPHLKFIQGFAEEIPFKDNYFDIVLLGDAIEHFRDPKATLAECLRVAKKSLAICIPIKEEFTEEHINPFNDERFLYLLDFFKLEMHFFNPEGKELSKIEALQGLQNFLWLLVRVEKTPETNDIVKEILSSTGKEIEKKAKEEILNIDQWMKDTNHSRHETEIARFNLVSHLIEGNKVLEIGCGNGDGSVVMAKKGFEVVGIDLSESGINQAFEIAKKENVQSNTNFFAMDATRLSFPDNSFDSIVIPEVLEHIRSSRKLLEEAVRVVRNGGRIIISIPDGLLVPWEGHLRVFFKDTITTELSQYASEIQFHELPFKKWLICSFFVKKNGLNVKEGPLVDVLMPTFNGRKTIERAIKSVINQTYQNWNLIVVNDGGDDISDIIKEFHDDRIKYICTDHKGKSHALNVGIKNSNGEYISYLDDDDLLYPIHIEILVKALDEKPNVFAYADTYLVNFRNSIETERMFEFRTDITPEMLLTMNYINHKCILHRRSILEQVGLYDEDSNILIDWDFIRRLAFASHPFHIWSVTSEHFIFLTDNGYFENRITGLWHRDVNKVLHSIQRIAEKTKDIPATEIELKRALIEALCGKGYFHAIINQKYQTESKQLNSQIIEQKNTLECQDSKIRELEAKIQFINQSITWRMVMKFKRTIDKLLPPGTRRHHYYCSVLMGLRVITNEGLRGIIKRTDRKTKYQKWFLENQPIKDKSYYKNEFLIKPKISIILPAYNTDERFLKLALESVENQIYDNWELCIIDDNSTKSSVRTILKNFAKQYNSKVKLKLLEDNIGVAGASNEAIKLATGDYITLLDHDDILTPDAIYTIVQYLNKNKEVKFFYSDEAIIDEKGKATFIYFRPDFSKNFFLSHQYIVHLVAIKKELFEKVKFDENFRISQDYDLFLRMFSELAKQEICHIPKILYLWRNHSKSLGHKLINDVTTSGKLALQKYIDKKNIPATIEPGPVFNTYRIRYKIIGNPLVSIIIPIKDKIDLLKNCLESIEKHTNYKNYEIIIINNNSIESKTLDFLNIIYGKYTILNYNDGFNYSKINNFGVKKAQGSHILFLNNDIEIISDEWLESMLEHSQRKEVGVVGGKLLYPNKTIQHAGVVLGLKGVAEHIHKFSNAFISPNLQEPGYISSLVSIKEYSAVTGACMMVRRDLFEEIGGFDENIAIGFNDIDLCLRIRQKGYLVIFTPYSLLIHYESESRKHDRKLIEHKDDKKYFLEKWKQFIEKGDPYYNPNLTLDEYDCTPRFR